MTSIFHIYHICKVNFLKWKNNHRIIVICGLLAIFLHFLTKDLLAESMQSNLPIAPWIFPFLFNHRYYKLLFFVPLIILFCDAPFVDETYHYSIIRSSRFKWCLGQLLYIFSASTVYFIFIFILSVVFCLLNINWTLDWGTFLGTAANTSFGNNLTLNISSKVVNCLTPTYTTFITLLLCSLNGMIIGLLIFLSNLIRLPRFVGVISAISLLLFDTMCVTNGQKNFYYYSPVTWTTISCLDLNNRTDLPSIEYAVVAGSLLLLVLLFFILKLCRSKSLSLLYKNRRYSYE